MKQLFILLITGLIACTGCRNGFSRQPKGPLFVQVHYTCPLRSISMKSLSALLNGKQYRIPDRFGRKRPVSIYLNRNMAAEIKKAYPRLKARVASFTFHKNLAGNRAIIAISDSRGLRPWLKTLYIDNILPWGKINRGYVLSPTKKYPFTLHGAVPWKPKRYVQIVQTGVTAMSRGFVNVVNRRGKLFEPIMYSREITSRAHLAITSSEVSFKDPCFYKPRSLRFCTPTRYFKLLTASGIDIVELTGNHNNDFGRIYNKRTIMMMHKAGMNTYGGGLTFREARKVLYKNIRGTTFAFTAFNEPGPRYAWATQKSAGAARLKKALFDRNISTAVRKGALVFTSIQCTNENNPRPWKSQLFYFHRAIDLGATIMVNSSAHRAMGIEFYKGKFISYGLGNFLFDQMHTINHRRGMLARHHFYNGKHIETELIPYLRYRYSMIKIVHGRKARQLFAYVFGHSRGIVFQ